MVLTADRLSVAVVVMTLRFDFLKRRKQIGCYGCAALLEDEHDVGTQTNALALHVNCGCRYVYYKHVF